MFGATSLSNSNHLPASEDSTLVNPVTLPPGRAKLSTKRSPTGSETIVNTIGIVRVCFKSAAVPLPTPASVPRRQPPSDSRFGDFCPPPNLILGVDAEMPPTRVLRTDRWPQMGPARQSGAPHRAAARARRAAMCPPPHPL